MQLWLSSDKNQQSANLIHLIVWWNWQKPQILADSMLGSKLLSFLWTSLKARTQIEPVLCIIASTCSDLRKAFNYGGRRPDLNSNAFSGFIHLFSPIFRIFQNMEDSNFSIAEKKKNSNRRLRAKQSRQINGRLIRVTPPTNVLTPFFYFHY